MVVLCAQHPAFSLRTLPLHTALFSPSSRHLQCQVFLPVAWFERYSPTGLMLCCCPGAAAQPQETHPCCGCSSIHIPQPWMLQPLGAESYLHASSLCLCLGHQPSQLAFCAAPTPTLCPLCSPAACCRVSCAFGTPYMHVCRASLPLNGCVIRACAGRCWCCCQLSLQSRPQGLHRVPTAMGYP